MNHQIGQGSYGRVYKGKQQNGQPVAIKVIDKRILNQVSSPIDHRIASSNCRMKKLQ